MSAGELNQRVTLLRRETQAAADGSGFQQTEFVVAATVWARVTPVSSSDSIAAEHRFPQTTVAFRLRWRAGVDSTWRIEWAGRTFDVVSVLPAGQRLREWLDVTAVESPAENPA